MVVSDKPRITGDIGGQPKITYWTPDGRAIKAMPDIHGYSLDGGSQVGTKDINLDKGWLLTKPKELKLYCPHCDMWHDTEDEIVTCSDKKEALHTHYGNLAQKELKESETERINKLESDIGEIKGLLKKLLEVKSGAVL